MSLWIIRRALQSAIGQWVPSELFAHGWQLLVPCMSDRRIRET